MPYRSSLGRFSKQSWNELNEEIKRAENEDLMEGIVAGCALVAYADGMVTDEEHDRMVRLIRAFEPIAAFGIEDVIASFDLITSRFASDPKEGEAMAFEAVSRVKGSGGYPAMLVTTCCDIATADGRFDRDERRAVTGICKALGLDPSTFEIVAA